MALKVGICGLGIMGGAFAANLLKSGFTVTGYDPDKTKVAALKKAGGNAGKSCADVARNADVIVTSLTSAAILLKGGGLGGDGVCESGGEPIGEVIVDVLVDHPRASPRLQVFHPHLFSSCALSAPW